MNARLLLLLLLLWTVPSWADTVACRNGQYEVSSLVLTGPPRYDVRAHRCGGGTNAGQACDSDANCPSSTCVYARGDGITDDTIAIQAAINAASQSIAPLYAVAGQQVYFACGTYKISSQLIIHSLIGYGVSLVGESNTCAVIQTAQDITMLRLGDWVSTGVDNWANQILEAVSVRDLWFRSTHSTGSNTAGVLLSGTSRSEFRNLIFSGPGTSLMTGIRVDPLSGLNHFDNISNFWTGADGAVGDLIWINGNAPSGSCPSMPGGNCENYNSPSNIYSHIIGHHVNKSIIHASGLAFGDMSIIGVTGTNTSPAAIFLQGQPGQEYATNISITNVSLETYSPGLECDYCRDRISLSGGSIANFSNGPSVVITGGPHYNLNYTSLTGGVNYAQ